MGSGLACESMPAVAIPALNGSTAVAMRPTDNQNAGGSGRAPAGPGERCDVHVVGRAGVRRLDALAICRGQ